MEGESLEDHHGFCRVVDCGAALEARKLQRKLKWSLMVELDFLQLIALLAR